MFFGASNGVGVLPTHNAGFRTFYPDFDHDTCTMCSLCWIYCPEGCLDRSAGKIRVDLDFCKGCGICAQECPKKCIRMRRDGE